MVAIDHSTVSSLQDLFLDSRDKFFTCETCFILYPVDAAQPGKLPSELRRIGENRGGNTFGSVLTLGDEVSPTIVQRDEIDL